MMLAPMPAARKDSLRRGAAGRRQTGRDAPGSQVFVGRPIEEAFQDLPRRPRGGENRLPHGSAHAPAGVSGNGGEGFGVRPRPDRSEDVALGGEAVVEQRGDDPRVGVVPERGEHPPAGRSGEVHPLGERHLASAPEE